MVGAAWAVVASMRKRMVSFLCVLMLNGGMPSTVSSAGAGMRMTKCSAISPWRVECARGMNVRSIRSSEMVAFAAAVVRTPARWLIIFFCAALASAVTGSFLRTVACTMALRADLKSFVEPSIVICGVRAEGRVSMWWSHVARLCWLYECLSRPIHARCVCILYATLCGFRGAGWGV